MMYSVERLGLGAPLAISAAHGIGIIDLLDTLTKQFTELGFEKIVCHFPHLV
jgi:predicted GTPase